MRTLALITVAIIFCCLSNNTFAYNTSGSMLHVDNAFFRHDKLINLTWKSDIIEYDYLANQYRLRIEFNSVGFQGSQGTCYVGSMIQNVAHNFVPDIAGSRFSDPATITDFPSLGLYFSSLHADWTNNKNGVKCLADNNLYPYFARVFENIDNLGGSGKNIYSRVNLIQNNINYPVSIKWIVNKRGTVTDPSENLSKDINGNWVSLSGTFVIWNFQVEINGTVYDVADYYLPIEYAEYICSTDPLVLHQEHFGGAEMLLNSQKTKVRYYDMSASDGTNCYALNKWNLTWRIDDGNNNLDNRFGWKVEDGKYLVSVCGHEDDVTNAKRDVNSVFELNGQLSVTPNFFTSFASQGSNTFDIETSANWTITCSENWLTTNTNSGSVNSTITINAEANTSANPRNATIVVTIPGIDTRIIKFTQYGIPLNSFPYQMDFTYWPIDNWVFEGGTLKWLPYQTNSVYVDFWNNDVENNALLSTPAFNFSGLNNPELTFNWSHKYVANYPDELKIEITTDGQTWITLWDKVGLALDSKDGALDETPGTYIPTSLNLKEFAGKPNVVIRFNGITGYGPDLFIDDVSIIDASVAKPVALTYPATNIYSSGATLNGNVNPNSALTSVSFEYGLTTSYGSTIVASPASINGSTPSEVFTYLNGLSLNTVYHYRVKAVNSSGTSFGDDATFMLTQGCTNLKYFTENVENSTGTYNDLESNGEPIITDNFDDANSVPQNIGFIFSYNCQDFTQFVLNTYGFIKLGDTSPSSSSLFYSGVNTNNGVFSSSNSLDNNIISPFTIDLTAGSSSPEYRVYTTGESPNRVCTIQYKNVRDKSTSPVQQGQELILITSLLL